MNGNLVANLILQRPQESNYFTVNILITWRQQITLFTKILFRLQKAFDHFHGAVTLTSINIYYEKYLQQIAVYIRTDFLSLSIFRSILPFRRNFYPDGAACIAGLFSTALSCRWLSLDAGVLGL